MMLVANKLCYSGLITGRLYLTSMGGDDGDNEIRKHGKAALVEFALRDAYMKNVADGPEKYFNSMAGHIRQQIHVSLESEEDFMMSLDGYFKDALIEYMAYICKGSNSLDNIKDVVNSLISSIPELSKEEKDRMNTIENRLFKDFEEKRGEELIQKGMQQGVQQGIQQGIQQGMQKIIQGMLRHGDNLETISEHTGLSSDEIFQILSGSESTAALRAVEGDPRLEQLTQSMNTMPEATASGSTDIAAASEPEFGQVAHSSRELRSHHKD